MNKRPFLPQLRLPMALLVCSALWACAATPPLQPPFTGHPRFQVLSPTLIRLEMAEDGHFEDSASINVVNRAMLAAFTSTSVNGWTEIKTEKILLRYRENSGPFAADNCTLQWIVDGKVGAPIAVFDPAAATPKANLGGWYRSLDGASAPVQLHDGLLSRDGWYLLDDTQTALWTATGWARPREQPAGYQDRYLFAYGKRGYTRRTWQATKCKVTNEVNTGKAAPFLADYLDALRCEGTSAGAIDAVAHPESQFPYPAAAPLCD